MLNLDRRAAQIGGSFNGRTQNHGGDKVPAFDLALSQIIIGEKELNSLLGDPHAEACLFDEPGQSSTMAMPRFPKLAPMQFREKVKGVDVRIWLQGDKEPIVLKGCDINRLTLEPKEGGVTELCCQLQATSPSTRTVGKLFEQLTHTAQVELIEAQEDLAEAAAVAAKAAA